MPGRETARVALNEVTVHGWDLARATGQDYAADPGAVAECAGFVAEFDAPANDDGGLFGPPVTTPADATAIDRLVGLVGRDPAGAVATPGPSDDEPVADPRLGEQVAGRRGSGSSLRRSWLAYTRR